MKKKSLYSTHKPRLFELSFRPMGLIKFALVTQLVAQVGMGVCDNLPVGTFGYNSGGQALTDKYYLFPTASITYTGTINRNGVVFNPFTTYYSYNDSGNPISTFATGGSSVWTTFVVGAGFDSATPNQQYFAYQTNDFSAAKTYNRGTYNLVDFNATTYGVSDVYDTTSSLFTSGERFTDARGLASLKLEVDDTGQILKMVVADLVNSFSDWSYNGVGNNCKGGFGCSDTRPSNSNEGVNYDLVGESLTGGFYYSGDDEGITDSVNPIDTWTSTGEIFNTSADTGIVVMRGGDDINTMTIDSITQTDGDINLYINSTPAGGTALNPTDVMDVTISNDSIFATAYIGSENDQAGSLTLNGNTTGDINFTGNGVLDLAADVALTGSIDSDIASQGELILGNGATVSGMVGDTNSLANVQLNNTENNFDLNESWNTDQFELNGTGSVNVGTEGIGIELISNILFSEDTTLNLGETARLIGSVITGEDGEGILTLLGNNTVESAIGTVDGNSLAQVNINGSGSTTLEGTVDAAEVNISAIGNVYIDGNVNGSVNVDNNGAGSQEINILGNVTSDGGIGIFASAQDGASQTIIVEGDVTGGNGIAISLTGDAAIQNISVGGFINGSVSTENNGIGTLYLTANNDSVVTGAVGGAVKRLKEINLAGSGTKQFQNAVFANDINIASTGNSEFSAAVVAGTINITENNITTFNNTVTGNTNIGAGVVNFKDNFNAGFIVNFTGDATLVKSSVGAILGNIMTDVNGTGTVILADNASIVGNVGSANAKLKNIQLNNTANNYDLNETWNTNQFELNGTGSVDVGADLSSNILFSTETTLAVENGFDLTGNIVTGVNGEGSLALSGNNTIDNTVGSSDLRLGEVRSATTLVGQVNTFNGDVFVSANTFHVVGAGLTQLNGNLTGNVLFDDDSNLALAVDRQINGNIDAVGINQGTLTLAGGNIITGTIGATNSLKMINIGGATATIFNDVIVTQGLNNTGKLNVGSSAAITASNGLQGDGAYHFLVTGNGASSAPSIGAIDVGNTAIDLSSNTVTAAPVSDGVIKAGTYNIITTTSSTASILPDDTLAYDSVLYSFTTTQNGDDNEDVALDIVRKEGPGPDPTPVNPANSNNKGVSEVLLSLSETTSDPQLTSLINAMSLAQTTAEYNGVLDQASNNTASTATATASQQATGAATGIVSSRMISASELANTQGNGIATGNRLENGWQAWGQTFYQRSDQGTYNSLPGYNANTYGITLGADTDKAQVLAGNTLLGAAFTYSYTGVSFQNNLGNSGINNYQLMLYGTTYIYDKFFMDGQIGGAYGFNDQTRNISVAGVSADSTLSSMQAIAQTRIGYNYTLFQSKRDKVTIAPMATGYYVYYWAQGYQETGAGGASLKVSDANVNTLQLGGALQLGYEHTFDNGDSLMPEIYGGWSYDVLDQNVSTTAQFVGGGAVFDSPGVAPARALTTAIIGLTYANAVNNYELNFQFQYLHRTELNVYAGVLEGSYNF